MIGEMDKVTKSNLENGKIWRFGASWPGQRCEAITRKGTPCQRPGNKINGRCRLHGGRSTGPRTTDGLERLVASKTKNGEFAAEKREAAKRFAEQGRQLRAELKEIEPWAVDHGHLTKDWRDKF